MKDYHWHKVADGENYIQWPESGIAVIEIEGKKLCLTKWKGRWFSFAYKCPHAGGVLSEAFIDKMGNIVCPLHGYRFNIRTGWDSFDEGYHLANWPVEERPDGIYIGLDEKFFKEQIN